MKQAGQKSSKEELPKQRKGPKRAEKCWLKVQTHIWEQEARGSSPRTPTISRRHLGEQGGVKKTPVYRGFSSVLSFIFSLSMWFLLIRLHQKVTLMKECVNPTELTAELLNTLIEKIVVHEAVKGEDGSREQEVEIFYRFIGKID